jgi:hypothetical protein
MSLNEGIAADIEGLGAAVVELKFALDQVKYELRQQRKSEKSDSSIYAYKDSTGRSILGEMCSNYANAYAAWVNLKLAAATIPRD